jgi:geranylgeranyl diphosphate synthase type II
MNETCDNPRTSNTYCKSIKHAVEERLQAIFPAHAHPDDLLTEAMRAAVIGAGKRLRPVLLISIARELGYDAPALLDLACAVEMVHAASLILDDLPCMDDAAMRRGAPALHRRFGEDIAVLASVALLSHAFDLVASAPDMPALIRTRLVAVLSQAIGTQGLAKGQFDDLRGASEQSSAAIAMTNDMKTGALLGVAVDMAAIVAQTSDKTTQHLRAFASATGQAFQIRDDLLDAGALEDAFIGKDTGQDEGKATLLSTLGVDGARQRMEHALRHADICLRLALGPGNRKHGLLAALFPQL